MISSVEGKSSGEFTSTLRRKREIVASAHDQGEDPDRPADAIWSGRAGRRTPANVLVALRSVRKRDTLEPDCLVRGRSLNVTLVGMRGSDGGHGGGMVAMHELSIAQNVVAAVCEHADGRRVHGVRLMVGALCAVLPDSIQFCFGVVTAGTVAEGARLEIETPAGAGHCRECGADFSLSSPILLCACGSSDVQVRSGRELQIVSIEVS